MTGRNVNEKSRKQASSGEVPHRRRIVVLCALSLLINLAVVKAPAAICFMPGTVGTPSPIRSALPTRASANTGVIRTTPEIPNTGAKRITESKTTLSPKSPDFPGSSNSSASQNTLRTLPSNSILNGKTPATSAGATAKSSGAKSSDHPVSSNPGRNSKTSQSLQHIDKLKSHIGTTQAVPGLSAAKSTITGFVDAQSMSASYYWTILLTNSGEAQQEAILHIALPEGATVSRATLWVAGVAREAAFAGASQVNAAYEWVKNGRQPVVTPVMCDPLIVTRESAGHILVKAAPVNPHGGEMKLMIGFTAPMQIERGSTSVMLPSIEDSNFVVDDLQDIHLESTTAVSSNDSGVLVERCPRGFLLKGNIVPEALGSLKIAVRGDVPATFATRATHSPEGTYILATLDTNQQGKYALNLEKIDYKPDCKILDSEAAAHRISTLWAYVQIEELVRQATVKGLEATNLETRFRTESGIAVQWSGASEQPPQEIGDNPQAQAVQWSASNAKLTEADQSMSRPRPFDSKTWDQIQAALMAVNVSTAQATQLATAYRVVSSVTGATVLERDSDYVYTGLSRNSNSTVAFKGRRLAAGAQAAPSLPPPPMVSSDSIAPSLSPPTLASTSSPGAVPPMAPAPSPMAPPAAQSVCTPVTPITLPAPTLSPRSITPPAPHTAAPIALKPSSQPILLAAPAPTLVTKMALTPSTRSIKPPAARTAAPIALKPDSPQIPLAAPVPTLVTEMALTPTLRSITPPATPVRKIVLTSKPAPQAKSMPVVTEQPETAKATVPASKIVMAEPSSEGIHNASLLLSYLWQILCGTLGLVVLLYAVAFRKPMPMGTTRSIGVAKGAACGLALIGLSVLVPYIIAWLGHLRTF